MNPVIAVENSTWNNIGDAFYQLSLEMCMREVFPDATITSFDGPFRRAFRPRRFSRNGYDARFATQADHYVLSGPILGKDFFDEYVPFIEHITAQGASYSLLSVHAYAEAADLHRLLKFFETHPPLVLQTRDSFTFNKLSSVGIPSYDGICFAFFVSKLTGIPRVKPANPFLAVSYHASPDPQIKIAGDRSLPPTDRIEVSERTSRNWRFTRHIDFLRTYDNQVGEFDIVRPVHGFYPSPHLSHGRPNSFITYNPLNFLAIYSNCSAVITDRVHAGVAALSHGKPAYVSSLDSRYAIFERAPVHRNGAFLELDKEKLEAEYTAIIKWLKETFVPLVAVR